MRNSRGFALILVLWFLVLIAAIATYILANGRSEAAIAHNIRAAANAEALADAGVAQAVFNQTNAVVSARWKLDGTPNALSMPAGEVTIRLYDEKAKINPNHASDVLMAALFEAAGVGRALARRLGAAVADWVSADPMPRPLGAKQEQYTAAGRSYGPPNGPVENLDELQLVLGMTPEILASVRPYLTLYTSAEEPTGKNAPEIVRRALILARRETELASADSGDAQDAMPEEEGEAAKPNAAAAPASDGAPAASAKTDDGEIVDIEIVARSPDGGLFVRHAVLRLDTSKSCGYAVLDWRRGELAE